jgi:hypothetical protein
MQPRRIDRRPKKTNRLSRFRGTQNGIISNETREKIGELASELQKTTVIPENEWLAVITRLTQFGAKPGRIDRRPRKTNRRWRFRGTVAAAKALGVRREYLEQVLSGRKKSLETLKRYQALQITQLEAKSPGGPANV